MRHGKRNQRLSKPTDARDALLDGLVKSLILHGQIQTTLARAKEASRLADRLVTMGKDGSIHARRRAYRILQDRDLVGALFTDIAPRFGDVPGGYTRVLRLSLRRGDGAQKALLAFSRLPAIQPAAPAAAKAERPSKGPAGPQKPAAPAEERAEKPKSFFEGIRERWSKKKKGSAAS